MYTAEIYTKFEDDKAKTTSRFVSLYNATFWCLDHVKLGTGRAACVYSDDICAPLVIIDLDANDDVKPYNG